MIPAAFDYVRPSTVDDAVAALAAAGEDGKVLAGGQSLLPVLRMRLSHPSTLVDLGRINSLRGVRDDGDALVIGAMTTHDEVLRDPLVAQHAPLLAQAAATVGDPQVRHVGTLGGSLSHADPAADLPTVALTLDASLEVIGPVRVPKLGAGWTTHYEKFNRVAQAWAIVAVAAAVRRSDGSVGEARVGLSNMGSTPLRASAVESALAGADASADAVRAASEHAAEGTHPPSDVSGGADYREHLARVLTRRAVLAAASI